jgi:magnesium-transporting ATPase (P-type)
LGVRVAIVTADGLETARAVAAQVGIAGRACLSQELLLPLIRAVVAECASYGYRRVTALLNRQLHSEGRARVNHKRIYRIM